MLHLHSTFPEKAHCLSTKCCKQHTDCFMRESLSSYPNSTLLQLACSCTYADTHTVWTSASMQGRVSPSKLELKDREKREPILFTHLHNMFCTQTHASHSHSCILVLGNCSTVHSMASDKPYCQTSQNYATQTMCRAKPRKSRWQLTREIERERLHKTTARTDINVVNNLIQQSVSQVR